MKVRSLIVSAAVAASAFGAVAGPAVAASASTHSVTAFVVNAHVLTSNTRVHVGEVLGLRGRDYRVASVQGSAFSLAGAGVSQTQAPPHHTVTFSVVG